LVAVLVPHPHQQQPPLTTVDGDLADDLVKALIEELLANGTEPHFPGLSLHEAFIEFILKLYNFYFGGGGGEDGLYPELLVVGAVFLGGEYFSEYIFCVVIILIFFISAVGVAAVAGADQNWGGVLDQRTLFSYHCSCYLKLQLLYRADSKQAAIFQPEERGECLLYIYWSNKIVTLHH
jgi:hypothetical protein